MSEQVTLPPRSEWRFKKVSKLTRRDIAARLKWEAEFVCGQRTAALGIGYVEEPPQDPEYWLQKADELLRERKKQQEGAP